MHASSYFRSDVKLMCLYEPGSASGYWVKSMGPLGHGLDIGIRKSCNTTKWRQVIICQTIWWQLKRQWHGHRGRWKTYSPLCWETLGGISLSQFLGTTLLERAQLTGEAKGEPDLQSHKKGLLETTCKGNKTQPWLSSHPAPLSEEQMVWELLFCSTLSFYFFPLTGCLCSHFGPCLGWKTWWWQGK